MRSDLPCHRYRTTQQTSPALTFSRPPPASDSICTQHLTMLPSFQQKPPGPASQAMPARPPAHMPHASTPPTFHHHTRHAAGNNWLIYLPAQLCSVAAGCNKAGNRHQHVKSSNVFQCPVRPSHRNSNRCTYIEEKPTDRQFIPTARLSYMSMFPKVAVQNRPSTSSSGPDLNHARLPSRHAYAMPTRPTIS